jgi:lysophospholipase L1-like esterase
MLTVRRRPRTLRDYVRAGQAQCVVPTTATGSAEYGSGRLFKPSSGDWVQPDVRFATSLFSSLAAGTVAFRVTPLFAGNDSTLHIPFAIRNSADNAFMVCVCKHSANTWRAYGNASYVGSTAQSFAANSVHNLVARWDDTANTVDLNYDGTDATQATTAFALDIGTYFHFSQTAPNHYIGPIILSPVRKSAGWVAAIQANSGAAFTDPMRLFRDFCAVGDVLIPFASDSTAFKKVAGTSPFDPSGLLVFDGCSLVSDTGVSPSQRMPDQVLTSLRWSWDYYNLAVGGQTTAEMLADAATQVDPKYRSDLEHNICVVWEGTNDLAKGATAQAAYDNLVTYCQGRRAAGYKVVIVTILPRGLTGFNEARNTVNASLRENLSTFADAIADPASDDRIGDDDDYADVTYYRDGVHMTAAGYAIVAGLVQTAIEGLL